MPACATRRVGGLRRLALPYDEPGGRAFVSDFDEKTRVTQVIQRHASDDGGGNDCVVVIYTKEPTLLGKRFVLDQSPHAHRPRSGQ